MKEGWNNKKIGEIAAFSQGIQVGLNKHELYPKEGYVRFIRIIDYTQNTDDIRYVRDPGMKYFVNEDDIVMVRYGTPGLIGRGKSGVIANNLFKITITHDGITKNYLSAYLSQGHIQKFLSTQGSATMPALNFTQLKTVDVSFPPLKEQQQIVAILDEAFAAIDQAKANIEKNIQNAKEFFQSKLNDIFSQRGDGWEEKTLGKIGQTQTGTTPPTKDESNYGDFISFVKPAHFQKDGSIDAGKSMLSETGLEKGRFFEANSVLMVCIGATIGKTGFIKVPVSSNQQINALTPSTDYVPKLLYYGLISPYVQNQVMQVGKSAQATLPIINKSKWEKLKVNLPLDKKKQLAIVKMLDDLNSSSMEIVKVYSSKLKSLEELKKSILQKAFAGELTNKMAEV